MFKSEIETLSIEASNPNELLDGRVLCALAHLRLQESHPGEAKQLVHTCLLVVPIHQDSRWIVRQVLRTLASAQSSRKNYEGAETSLLQALRLTAIRELDDASAAPMPSSSSMMVVHDLRQLYKHVGEKAKYKDLRLRYLSGFGEE
jgi:hypothetical protein